MEGLKKCKFCESTESDIWWKCCPEHTSEQGTDVVCQRCMKEKHPKCDKIRIVSGWGMQMESCEFPLNHAGYHSFDLFERITDG